MAGHLAEYLENISVAGEDDTAYTKVYLDKLNRDAGVAPPV